MGNYALTGGVFVKTNTTIPMPLRKNFGTDEEFESALDARKQAISSPRPPFLRLPLREDDPGTRTSLETTVPVQGGSSGSPLFNISGEVGAIICGRTGIETISWLTGEGSLYQSPSVAHIMHSVPVVVSREWASGTPAWKAQDLISKWLDVEP